MALTSIASTRKGPMALKVGPTLLHNMKVCTALEVDHNMCILF